MVEYSNYRSYRVVARTYDVSVIVNMITRCFASRGMKT